MSGVVIGYHHKEKRFLAIDVANTEEMLSRSMPIRFATSEELNAIGTYEPRSVAEHRGIRQRMTPYGLARVFGKRPRIKPVVVKRG